MNGNSAVSEVMAERIEKLWNIQEIKNLALKYAYAVDTRDWPLMESLWIETASPADGLLDIHLMRTVPQTFEGVGSSTMFVANHLIEFDGSDLAHGAVYCHCMVDGGVFMPDGEIFFEQAIIYKDIYERVEGEWKFRTRDHLLWWGVEHKDNPMKQRPANWPVSQVGAGNASEAIRCA